MDYNRVYGGRRQAKKSPPLSLADSPGKSRLVELGHYYKNRKSKFSLSGRARLVSAKSAFCIRRYSEAQGTPCGSEYLSAPSIIESRPSRVFEVEGVASFTSGGEAALSAFGKHITCKEL